MGPHAPFSHHRPDASLEIANHDPVVARIGDEKPVPEELEPSGKAQKGAVDLGLGRNIRMSRREGALPPAPVQVGADARGEKIFLNLAREGLPDISDGVDEYQSRPRALLNLSRPSGDGWS